MRTIKLVRYALGFSALLLSVNLYAQPAPVEDLGQSAEPELERPAYLDDGGEYRPEEQEHPQLSFTQRVAKLERQVQNINRNNFSNKFDQLQEQLQQLRGELEQQQHDIKVLAQQQKQFYSDLNDRLAAQQKTAVQQRSVPLPPEAESSTAAPKRVTTALTEKENQSYRDAFELLKSKQYDDAITAFQKYLMQFPNGHYVVNSNYWLGEVYYLQGKPSDAKKAFTVVVTNYPNSQKMPDAMLKLAIIAIDAGDVNKGRDLLDQVQQRFPGTTAARLAALRSQELKLSS